MLLLRKISDKYSSLHILCEFVCYFWSKAVTSIQAYTYCVNLCATFTQNVWLTLFYPESVHFKEFALFLLQIGLCCDLRVPCVKLLVLKLRSRKFFDKFHVRRCGRIIKTKQIKQNQQLNKWRQERDPRSAFSQSLDRLCMGRESTSSTTSVT